MTYPYIIYKEPRVTSTNSLRKTDPRRTSKAGSGCRRGIRIACARAQRSRRENLSASRISCVGLHDDIYRHTHHGPVACGLGLAGSAQG